MSAWLRHFILLRPRLHELQRRLISADIGQTAPESHLHRAINRDVSDSGAAINPAVRIQPFILRCPQFLQIGSRLRLQTRLRTWSRALDRRRPTEVET